MFIHTTFLRLVQQYHYVDVRNYCPNKNTGDQSPMELITGERVDLNIKFPHAFGDFLAVAIPEPGRVWKFDLKRDLGIYVGQPPEKRGMSILNPQTGAIVSRMDAVKIEITDTQFLQYFRIRSDLLSGESLRKRVDQADDTFGEELAANLDQIEEVPPDEDVQVSWRVPLAEITVEEILDRIQYHPEPREPPRIKKNRHHDPQQGTRHLRSRAYRECQEITSGFLKGYYEDRMFAGGAKVTVGHALRGDEREEWADAIKSEVRQLMETGTLEETSDEEAEKLVRTVIRSTMALRKKLIVSTGELDKYKARLCACGNELHGMTEETYSPTIAALAYAAVHQVAVIDRMNACIVDTVGAYLYQDYPKDARALFIVLPKAVSVCCGLRPGALFRVRKYLYGLPDAGLAYYRAYSSHLIASGYKKSMSDPCLFYRVVGNERTYAWCHVDDTFVCSNHIEGLKRFVREVEKQFKVTVNLEVDQYLGLSFENMGNGDVKMTQPRLLQSLLDEYYHELSVHMVRGILTPQRVMPLGNDTDDELMSQGDYLHLEGALIYLTKSRPDISTAVSFGATHSAYPTYGAFTELLHCLKYLEKTRDQGLILKAGEPGRSLQLLCYVDASYLTHQDSYSHQGFTLSFGSIGTFYSKSSKQKALATSSTQAEMRALYTATAEIIFLVHLMEELERPITLPCIVMEDNSAVVALSQEATTRTKKCKHFLVLVHWIREQVALGIIEVRKVATERNMADIFTKIVTGQAFLDSARYVLGSE